MTRKRNKCAYIVTSKLTGGPTIRGLPGLFLNHPRAISGLFMNNPGYDLPAVPTIISEFLTWVDFPD